MFTEHIIFLAAPPQLYPSAAIAQPPAAGQPFPPHRRRLYPGCRAYPRARRALARCACPNPALPGRGQCHREYSTASTRGRRGGEPLGFARDILRRRACRRTTAGPPAPSPALPSISLRTGSPSDGGGCHCEAGTGGDKTAGERPCF